MPELQQRHPPLSGAVVQFGDHCYLINNMTIVILECIAAGKHFVFENGDTTVSEVASSANVTHCKHPLTAL